MHRLLRRLLVVALALVVVGYGGLQFLRYGLDGRYRRYVNPDLESARERGLLLGEYRAACADTTFTTATAFVARPTKKKLGYLLLGTRIVTADVATVLVDLGSASTLGIRLAFDDGAGGRIVDGRAAPHYTGPNAGDSDPNDDSCCSSHRSRVPERFWLARDGVRVCEFRLDEATRTDAPARTRWTW